ncbi:MAG: hypothetical protein P8M70_12915 [Verrucomicrobiota bacterium]|jgi:hypothetical protein|nr:hypothetical protein [Verrucomicrobiota bacterium]
MKKTLINYLLLVAFLLSSIACKQVSKLNNGAYVGPFYTVGNIYMTPEGLPPQIRRVAMLPLVPSRGDRSAERGIQFMQPVLTQEFSRNRIFDVVTIPPDRLQRMFGRRAIYADEPLPHDFLPRLKQETGCQAVLFTELITFRPYPPVAVGWKLHLFDLDSEELIWAVDEVFDGGHSAVANSLRRFIRKTHSTHNSAAVEILVLDSPREMARFSIAELIPTLLKKNPKVAVNPAESNSSQRVSGEPDIVGPKPAPAVDSKAEESKNPAPTDPDSGAI